jgi:hypothetical protein
VWVTSSKYTQRVGDKRSQKKEKIEPTIKITYYEQQVFIHIAIHNSNGSSHEQRYGPMATTNS